MRTSDGTEVEARAVVVATGVTWRRLGVPRLEALVGSGVFHGVAGAEAQALTGQDVLVVGAGNSAGQVAWRYSSGMPSTTSSSARPRMSKISGGWTSVSVVRATIGFSLDAWSFGAFLDVHMTICEPSQVKLIGMLRGVPSLAT